MCACARESGMFHSSENVKELVCSQAGFALVNAFAQNIVQLSCSKFFTHIHIRGEKSRGKKWTHTILTL